MSTYQGELPPHLLHTAVSTSSPWYSIAYQRCILAPSLALVSSGRQGLPSFVLSPLYSSMNLDCDCVVRFVNGKHARPLLATRTSIPLQPTRVTVPPQHWTNIVPRQELGAAYIISQEVSSRPHVGALLVLPPTTSPAVGRTKSWLNQQLHGLPLLIHLGSLSRTPTEQGPNWLPNLASLSCTLLVQ
jgi:hypothetical protein